MLSNIAERSRNLLLLAAVALQTVLGSSAGAATVVFEDTFDSDTLGLGLTGTAALTQWDITGGNLDVIGPGLFDFFPGNGRYLDMGGFSSNATIETKAVLSLTPGSYELTFELAFPPGFNQNVLDFSVGTLLVDSIAPTSNSALLPVAFSFLVPTATNAVISFSETGALIDDGGTILNDVRLTRLGAIPEPSTALFLGFGLVALSAGRRSRKRAA